MQINDNIKKARELKGYSQARIAELLGEKRSTYAEWERSTVPKADILAKISQITGVTMSDLLDEKPSSNGHRATGTVPVQHLLDEKEQRIKEIEASRLKIEQLLAEANEEKRQLIATLQANMKMQEQQLKTMEANLVRGQHDIQNLMHSNTKYWEDVLIGDLGLLVKKDKLVRKKAGISKPGK